MKLSLLAKKLTLLFLLTIGSQLYCQENETELKQRALFLINVSSSFKWDKAMKKGEFVFGIYKDKPLFLAVSELAKTRLVNGIKIKPKLLSKTSQVKEVDLVFADRNRGDIAFQILKEISSSHTLFVGENFKFQECHINLLLINSEFVYEINKNRLYNSGFTIPNQLKIESVESSSKWYSLYEQSSKNLTKQKKYNILLQEEILKKEGKIKDLSITKDSLSREVQLLLASKQKITTELGLKTLESQRLKNKIEAQKSKITILKNNEESYRVKISLQIDSLNSLKHEIRNQEKILVKIKAINEKSREKIQTQQNSIKSKNTQISRQNYLLFFIVTILVFSLLIALLLLRSNRLKKRNNLLLTQKNKQIEQRKMEMEQFAYAASHDLAAPVNTILGFSLLLLEKGKEYLDEKDLLFLKEITNSSERMKELIKDLLEFAQIGQDGEKESFYLEPLLDEIKVDLHSAIKDTTAQLNVHIPNDTKIRARKTEIRRLLQNLIVNAIKFKTDDESPIITVNCIQVVASHKRKTTVTIADNGIGIEDEFKEKIFNVFSRLHSEEEYEGTGIGLAQCKKIVQRHSGKIWVEDNPSGGSIFTFTVEETD